MGYLAHGPSHDTSYCGTGLQRDAIGRYSMRHGGFGLGRAPEPQAQRLMGLDASQATGAGRREWWGGGSLGVKRIWRRAHAQRLGLRAARSASGVRTRRQDDTIRLLLEFLEPTTGSVQVAGGSILSSSEVVRGTS